MDDDRLPSHSRKMWLRFAVAALLIAGLSGGATATIALNEVENLGGKFFNKNNTVPVKPGLIKEYTGGPQTYLVLGTDRRPKSKDALDRTDPPHSDTILLVRFDPGQGQTSVLSIPRDLLVNIKSSKGEYYPQEKINAAYTYGAKLGGVKGSMELAAETIEKEVFPGLEINGIVDVNFASFIKIVDTLGCVYVNVDHRYLHVNGEGGELYSEINLQPGYQKLCYNNALSYVRYRHGDSDFVRVARQQDFLRALREQVSASDLLGQVEHVATVVGKAIVTAGFSRSADRVIELAKLIAFSQGKPLRQVKFRAASTNFALKGGSYVTTTEAMKRATLDDFLNGDEKVAKPKPAPKPKPNAKGHHHSRAHGSSAPTAASLGLSSSGSAGEAEIAKGTINMPLKVLYPSLQTASSVEQPARAYDLRDQGQRLRHAYVAVWRANALGGYYDFEGTDWQKPPLIAHPNEQRKIKGVTYMIFTDGSHIHVVAWRQGHMVYWLTNTLLEDLSNEQMLAIARSAKPLH
ncbi:MAG TPA: LCP family protein [Solirubrobacteraceae bacterium]|jgi:LCP family protein required for cell wall assembly|nr:LCP family protein [Solirubrobacteraceae bacterium]